MNTSSNFIKIQRKTLLYQNILHKTNLQELHIFWQLLTWKADWRACKVSLPSAVRRNFRVIWLSSCKTETIVSLALRVILSVCPLAACDRGGMSWSMETPSCSESEEISTAEGGVGLRGTCRSGSISSDSVGAGGSSMMRDTDMWWVRGMICFLEKHMSKWYRSSPTPGSRFVARHAVDF